MQPKILLFVIIYFMLYQSFGQTEIAEVMTQESVKNSVRLSVGVGHAYVKKGEEHTEGISTAYFYLDVDYWLSEHIAAGVQTDLILENYMVEEHNVGESSMTYEHHIPVSFVPVFIYRPFHHILLIGGYGYEFGDEENYSLARGGIEYGIELPKKFEFGISAVYDVKVNTYDTWVFGLGISKFFGGNSKRKVYDDAKLDNVNTIL